MKLSIITINYNNAVDLAKTIKSVVSQTWKSFEYIIIDGGSSDGSVDLIKQYEDFIAYWVSEPDEGIYHAMNKGIDKAKGEYLLMLNAGDVLCSNRILETVFEESKITEDIVYGDVFRESKGQIFTESIFPDRLTFNFLRNGAISHQAAFIRRNLHDVVGLYDENLKLSSDWAFILLAICKHNASYKHLPYKLSTCNSDGLTCSPVSFSTIIKERQQVITIHFSAFVDDYKKFDKIINGRINKRANRISKQLLLECKGFVKTMLQL